MLVPKVTDTDFLNSGFITTTIGAIEELGAIKTLSFNDYTGHREKSVSIHDSLVILPIRLHEHQNILRITENLTTELNVELRFAITDDLIHYYNYVGGSFVEIQNISNGMPLNILNNVDLTNWGGDIGIAVSIQEKTVEKKLEVNNLFIMLNTNINIGTELMVIQCL